MKPNLIVYNLCAITLNQNSIVEYIKSLLNEFEKENIDTKFIKVLDGNKLYPKNLQLFSAILNYWNNERGFLPLVEIYYSVCALYRYLKDNNLPEYFHYGCDDKSKNQQKEIAEKLIKFTKEISNLEPDFFFML